MRYSSLIISFVGFMLPVMAASAQSQTPEATAAPAVDIATLFKPAIADETTQRDPALSSEEEITTDSVLAAQAPEPAPVEMVELAGRVLDEDNKPLVGATVYVRGAALAASTDANGNYKLKVPAGVNKLLYSYGGYSDKEIEASNFLPVNVQLEPRTYARIKNRTR